MPGRDRAGGEGVATLLDLPISNTADGAVAAGQNSAGTASHRRRRLT